MRTTANLTPGEALHHALAYVYIDGLWEIAYGLSWLFLAFFFLLGRGYPNATLVSMAFVGLALILGFFSRRIVNGIKERWIYPRTGYVALRRTPLTWRLGLAAVLIFVITVSGLSVLVAAFDRGVLPVTWFPVVLMLTQVLSVLLPITFYHRNGRYYVLLLASLVVSVLFYKWAFAIWGILTAYFVGLSGGLVFSGAIKLLVYWCRPRPGEAEHVE